MYRPKHFDCTDPDIIKALIRENDFALLVSQGDQGLEATHLPLYLKDGPDGSAVLMGHVSKGNGQWRTFDGGREALAVFTGPDAYVSPTWYDSHPSVPTWNYEAVHAYGTPKIIEDTSEVWAALKGLVELYEPQDKSAWKMEDLPEGYKRGQMKGIVAFEMPVSRFEAKRKLSQNRTLEDRENVAGELAKSGTPDDQTVAERMAEELAKSLAKPQAKSRDA